MTKYSFFNHFRLFVVPVLLAALLAPQAQATDIVRVGIGYVPPAPKISDTRLYTEEGFELGLARELGQGLQRQVLLVPVAEEEQARALNDGRIDIAIGSFAIIQAPAPRQYSVSDAAGLSVSMRSDTAVRNWKDLSGKIVCVAEANERARQFALSLGAQVRQERAPARSLMRVRTGDCDAAIHEKPLLDALFSDKNWQKFSATLPPAEPAALVVTVAPQADEDVVKAVERVVSAFGTPEHWRERRHRWAANVAFEVYLDQDAPDCHT